MVQPMRYSLIKRLQTAVPHGVPFDRRGTHHGLDRDLPQYRRSLQVARHRSELAAKVITLDKIKEWVATEKVFNLKYVRLATEYRFCGLYEEHKSLVTEAEQPTVLSAGLIGYPGCPAGFRVGGESTTLNKNPLPDDAQNIKKLFGLDISH